MRRLLRYPWLAILVVLPLAIGGYLAYQNVQSGFMPAMDEGGFIFDYIAPAGTSLTETQRLLQKVESILQSTPEVQAYSRRTGLGFGGGFVEPNMGDIFVRLKPQPRRDIDEVMSEVRNKVESTIPGLQVETSQLMEDLIGDLTAVPQPIEVKLYSDDQKALMDLGPKVADAIGKVRGVVEIKSGIVLAGDAISIEVDRVKAALEGVDPDAVTRTVTDALSGNVTTEIQRGPKLIGVRVWIPSHSRATEKDIASLQIRAPNGRLFPLSRVATLTVVTGQPEINRENLRRMIAVTARIENRDLGSTAVEIKHVLDQNGLLPAGIQYELGGLYQQQQIAFRGLLTVIIAGAVLVFLLLLFLYESFLIPIAILMNTALAMAAVFIGLWITKTELNITSLMGMVMIVGNVTEVAIFYYSEYTELPIGDSHGLRLIHAGENRIRAILMTTIAAILALLPLALGIGEGSEMLKPLAIAIISGLVVQLPLTLVVLPALLRTIGAARPAEA